MLVMKLKEVSCIQCNKKIVAVNAIRWNGQYYGKGCFNKHIRPMLLAKKLDDKNFYSIARKTVISLISEMEIENSNSFTNDIQFQAKKGFISFNQERSFYINLNVSERVKFISDLTDIMAAFGLNKEKSRSLHEFYYRMFDEFLSVKKFSAELRKAETKADRSIIRANRKVKVKQFEYTLMSELNKLYQTNDNFKQVLNLYHGDDKTDFVNFLLGCDGFTEETQSKLLSRYDSIVSSKENN